MTKEISKIDLITVEQRLLDLRIEKNDIIKRKIETESSLVHCQSEYSKVARNSKEFQNIKERRLILKNVLCQLELDIKKVNDEIKTKNKTRLEVERYLHLNNTNDDNDIEKVCRKINLLKSKYKEFAKDRTRIASLRIMASEFIEELDKITK